MKLILSLPLIWTLFSTAGALVCQTCTDTRCSTTEALTCSSETMCITASFEATVAGAAVPQLYKACASSSLCPVTGSQTYSVNLGGSGAISSAQCCNSDNCNSETLPTPTPQTPNTLQCLTCDATTSQCTSSVQCTEIEDRCFQGTVMFGSSLTPVSGCVSSNLCAANSSLGSPFFFPSNGTGGTTSRLSCCETDLCNTAPTRAKRAPASNAATPSKSPKPNTTTTKAKRATTTTKAKRATTTTKAKLTTPASNACSISLGLVHLLLGLLIFTLR